jgi:Polyketide cyclase / dehydrase and lipid transport
MTVSVKERLDAPIERVWEVVGDFGGLKRWHPAVERCEMFGSGIGARRVLHFRDWIAEEELELLDTALHTCEYRVTSSSKPETVGVWCRISLTRIRDDRTAIEWRAEIPRETQIAAQMEQMIATYFPTRISHLREALGLRGNGGH